MSEKTAPPSAAGSAAPDPKPSGGAPRAAGKKPDVTLLVDLVNRLRAPDGCPWDREQGIGDLRAYLLEEAHEVAAAISSGDRDELAGELGDLLFLMVFVAQLGAEEGSFDLGGVIERVHAKMIARHPHVFGDETAADADAVRASWERRKLAQKDGRESLLAGVPASLPALVAAYRLGQKAAGVGFDWPDVASVVDKVHEELAEVEAELETAPSAALREEIGDLLFTVAHLARRLEIDPEAALADANLKFRRRFAAVEEAFARRGENLAEASLERLDAEWEAVKANLNQETE